MKKKKSLTVEHDFFSENSSQLGVFWPRQGLQANHRTVRKSAIFPQPSNQKQLKCSNIANVNKWSFVFKIELCVSQGTGNKFCMKIIRIFKAQPVKIAHFKSLLTRKQARWLRFLLHFLMFISWMLITPSFKKSLIVEQFQGNYLNPWTNILTEKIICSATRKTSSGIRSFRPMVISPLTKVTSPHNRTHFAPYKSYLAPYRSYSAPWYN